MNRPDNIGGAIAHAPSCTCDHCDRAVVALPARRPSLSAVAPEALSLVQRFSDAAEPGDWSALAIGLALGVLLDTVFVIAAYWDALLAMVGAN